MPLVQPLAALVAAHAVASASSSPLRAWIATSEMFQDHTSEKPLVSMSDGPSSWPGPRIASRRLTVFQPLRTSGTWTILPAFGFGVPRSPTPERAYRPSDAFWRPVVNIVCSACVLVMYGNRCMISASTAAECGPAIEVPDALA